MSRRASDVLRDGARVQTRAATVEVPPNVVERDVIGNRLVHAVEKALPHRHYSSDLTRVRGANANEGRPLPGAQPLRGDLSRTMACSARMICRSKRESLFWHTTIPGNGCRPAETSRYSGETSDQRTVRRCPRHLDRDRKCRSWSHGAFGQTAKNPDLGYLRWYGDNLWTFVPAQGYIKKFLSTIPEYPFQEGSSLNAAGINYNTLKTAAALKRLHQLETLSLPNS